MGCFRNQRPDKIKGKDFLNSSVSSPSLGSTIKLPNKSNLVQQPLESPLWKCYLQGAPAIFGLYYTYRKITQHSCNPGWWVEGFRHQKNPINFSSLISNLWSNLNWSLHYADGGKISLQHHVAGSLVSPLHFAAGSLVSLLHFAAVSQISPLHNAQGCQVNNFFSNLLLHHEAAN